MRRSVYRSVLWLHPPVFRRQFGPEMLGIFDEAVHLEGARALLIDGLVSLARQWILRSGLWRFAVAICIAATQTWAGLHWAADFWQTGPKRAAPAPVSPENLLEIACFALAFVAVMATATVGWARHVIRR